MQVYAIGDVHGQRSMLEDALARIEADGGAGAPVVFLGDLTDRGPDSARVLDLIIAGIAEGRNWTVIKGNHDRMFHRFVEPVAWSDPHLMVGLHWLHARLGGDQTLRSYGVDVHEGRRYGEVHADAIAAIPAHHLDFLRGLPLWHEAGELLFVHAGIRPGLAIERQSENDLVWIREPFLSDTRDHGALVVHGHTALDAPMHGVNRVNLDSGAGYGRPLTVAVFEHREVWVLGKTGRRRLRAAVA